MYYTVYKITNQINGKIYIGSHKTKNLNDNYMGSGKYLKRAQKKYGMENFTREILFVFYTPELMYAKESELVTEDFIAEENTYNMKVGGNGGWDFNNERITAEERSRRGKSGSLKSKTTGNLHNHPDIEQIRKLATKNRMLSGKPFDSFKGKKHSAESKQKISNSMKDKQSAENNSQFGTMWITNGSENKKINKIGEIPEGWRKGRVLK